MSDQNPNPPDGGTGSPDGNPDKGGDSLEYYKTEIKKIAEQRDAAKQEAAKLREETAKQAEEKLKEQNKYKELYETKEQELIRLAEEKKSLESYKTKWDDFETAEKAKIKTALGDKWKQTFENFDLTALKDLAEITLGSSHLHTPPNGGSGAGGKEKDPSKMTESEYIAWRKEQDKK